MVVWHFVIQPSSSTTESEWLETALRIAYAVGDLIIILGVVSILLRRPNPSTRNSLNMLAAGFMCFCVADFGFAWLTQAGSYAGDDWPAWFWLIAVCLMALSAHWQHWRMEHALPADSHTHESDSPFTWIPYATIGLAYGLLVWVSRFTFGEPVGGLILGAVLLTALVVARQIVAVRENNRLLAEVTERRSEARFNSLVRNLTDMIAVCDVTGGLVYWSPSLVRAIGWEPASGGDVSLLSLVHPLDVGRVRSYIMDVSQHDGLAAAIEFRLIRGGDYWRNVEATASNVPADEGVGGIVLNIRDISERKMLEDQLTHQAFHDTLTGLANRALFHDRVQHALARNARSLAAPAVLFLDIDDFKTVNDSLGHGQGDQMLVTIAERLRACLRAGDTAARIGGDEFAILLEDVTHPEDATAVADRIVEALRTPMNLQGRDVIVEASIGIAARSSFHERAEDLLRNADVAMYSVKARGKNGVEIFAPHMHENMVNRLSVRSDLQGAVERNEFRLHYQPIVSLETEELVGVEALVRWQHPQRGMVPPAEFISLAEESGLIIPIGKWVIAEACRQTSEWHQLNANDGRPPISVSVNLSSRQLEHPDLLDHVAEGLLRSRIDPGQVTLEITESLLMQHTEVSIRKLRELRDLGVGLAIDDFGTGYSSLSYLRRFPVDVLKIDKSFIDGIEDDTEAETLVRAIVSLGQALRLRVVAEGIEHLGQLERLREMGCDRGQGFYFGKPLTAEQLTERLVQLPASLARRLRFGTAA